MLDGANARGWDGVHPPLLPWRRPGAWGLFPEPLVSPGVTMNDSINDPTNRTSAGPLSTDLAPPDYAAPLVQAYKKDVDRTLLRENLKLSVEERLLKAERVHESVAGWRGAARHPAGAGPQERS